MKEIVSIGNIKELVIPDDLQYKGALLQLIKDASETGITIDLNTFYTTEVIQLHNFVDTITYKFVIENKQKLLVYEITSRPNNIYKEVLFDGTIIASSSYDIEFNNKILAKNEIQRRKENLGI